MSAYEKNTYGAETTYQYVGDQLLYENRNGTDIYYFYDSYGTPTAIRYYKADGTSYRFFLATNSLGDVIGLYNANGTLAVKYEYDAWGNILSTTDADGDALNSLSQEWSDINPFRYRGYYYDSETGLYYLQSRYYDPEVGRFLNADSVDYIGYSDSALSYNMFAYCENNGVNGFDKNGYGFERLYEDYIVAVNVFYNNNKASHADIEISKKVYSYGNYARNNRPVYIEGSDISWQGRLLIAEETNWYLYNKDYYDEIRIYYIIFNKIEYTRTIKYLLSLNKHKIIEQIDRSVPNAEVAVYKFTSGKYKRYIYPMVNCATFVRDMLSYGLGYRFYKAANFMKYVCVTPGRVEKIAKKLSVAEFSCKI